MNNRIFRTFIFFAFISFGLLNNAHAQVNFQNLSSVNVDNLTDQQIKKLIQDAQNAGLSDADLLQQARSRGVSPIQIQKLQDRVRDIRSKNPSSNSADTTIDGRRRPNYKEDKDSADSSATQQDIFESLKPKIFGADLFKTKNSSFEPNLKLATPVNYIVGPEDQLNINVYGNSLVNWKLEVSPEGNINIPGIGIVNVSGKTIENVTTLIKSKLSANNYAIGRGTSVQVSLGNIRSIKVIMIGQLMRPGTYTLSSLATVFNALYVAGGPNENGSFRQIEVIRNNKIIRRLDVYDFLVKGDQKDNISLHDQDIVRVPTYRTRVEMAGQVKIPALFEVLPGENLQNIINYAGGFTDSAYTARIKVLQIDNQQRKLTDVVEADYSNYIPLRGDKYFVSSIIDRIENRVTINGAVFRPGEFELQNGLTLSQLIANAAGLKEDAFTERGTITRLKPDNSTEIIDFSVKDVLNKVKDITLQREDVVNISSIFDLRDKYTVTINGSVRKPGVFAFGDNMKVEDLILKAGGFAEGATSKRIEVARRVNDADPKSKNTKVAQVFSVNVDNNLKVSGIDFILKPFDIVSIYSLPGYEKQKTVKVEGEVLYPGSYTIETKNEKISDLINRAGGLTVSADVGGGSLKRENIAILGIDKTKSDTTAIAQERTDRLNRLKRTYKDSTKTENSQPRNNYVGIDLQKILNTPGSKIDLLLEDGDILRIPKQQQIVRVNGEVLYPSAVVFDKTKSFKGYVLNAGGFSPTAYKRGSYIIYPNGTVKGTRKFLFFNSHPSVKPGSEIYVPVRPKSIGNTIGAILGFTTGLASLGAIILGIISVTKK
ncbi:SLBB domain-containing protein [Mucilaginibacter sp.]|uniref:SLBB domain-containing protein n=1 Tax=Mucilaginibacter sp. TaxID=1882438 RepID=UPI003B001B44